MKNLKNEHFGYIKDNSILLYVEGVKKNPSFVYRIKEECVINSYSKI